MQLVRHVSIFMSNDVLCGYVPGGLLPADFTAESCEAKRWDLQNGIAICESGAALSWYDVVRVLPAVHCFWIRP